MITLTETSIKKYKFIDESVCSEGRHAFWHVFSDYIANMMFAEIQFREKLTDGVGGFYSSNLYKDDKILKDLNGIALPLETVTLCTDPGNESIKFNSELDFATFVHEVSHFYHVVRDKFEYQCPYIIRRDPDSRERIDCEYEAGWRSLMMSKEYSLFPDGDRTLLEMNLVNMLHYIDIVNAYRFKDCDPKVFERRQKEWVATVSDFSQIHDYEVVV